MSKQKAMNARMGQSQVMRLVYTAIRDARQQQTMWIPVRLIRHAASASLPFSLRLLRPEKVLNLSQEMRQDGFRQYEPVLVTEVLRSILDNKYYASVCVAGNARIAAARQTDFVFVPSHVIREKSIAEMVCEMETEDHLFQVTSSNNERLERVLSLLIVGAQHKEPYPESMSPLQQVALLRTYKCNDLYGEKGHENSPKTYGKASELRVRLFGPNYALYTGQAPHFLKRKWDDRNLNKLIRGAMQLIEAEIVDQADNRSGSVEGNTVQESNSSPTPIPSSNVSVLDLLLSWECEELMPPFLETHIMNASNLTINDICTVVRQARDELARNEGKALQKAVLEDRVLKSVREKGHAMFASEEEGTISDAESASARRAERRKRRAGSHSPGKTSKRHKNRARKIAIAESKEITSLKEQVENLQAKECEEVRALKDELGRLRASQVSDSDGNEIRELKKELEDLKRKESEELTTVRTELEMLRLSNAENGQKEEIEALKLELRATQKKEQAEKRAHVEELERLRLSGENAESEKISALKAELATLKNEKIQEIRSMKDELEQLRALLKEKTEGDEIQSLKKELESMRDSEREQVLALKREVHELQAQLQHASSRSMGARYKPNKALYRRKGLSELEGMLTDLAAVIAEKKTKK